MKSFLILFILGSTLSLALGQNFKLFPLQSEVYGVLQIKDEFFCLVREINVKNNLPIAKLYKLNKQGETLEITILSDSTMKSHRFENILYDKAEDEILIVGIRRDLDNLVFIDIKKIKSNLSILTTESINLENGIMLDIFEIDRLHNRLLIYGQTRASKILNTVVLFDMVSKTVLKSENIDLVYSPHDMLLLPDSNKIMLSYLGLKTTNLSGFELKPITLPSIKQKGSSNGEKFLRYKDNSYLLHSSSALVSGIYEVGSEMKTIIYQLDKDFKVKKWKEISESKEYPSQTTSISVYDESIFAGSNLAALGFEESFKYFRVSKLDNVLNVKWSKQIYPEQNRICILSGITALDDGGCLAFGALKEPELTITTPFNRNSGFILRFDSLGNTVPFDLSTKVEDQVKQEIKIYPNPVANDLFIDAPLASMGKNSRIKIYNLVGQIMIDEVAKERIDVSELRNGVYLYEIKIDDKKLKIGKFIKTN